MSNTTNAVQVCILSRTTKQGRSTFRFYQKLDGSCYAHGGHKSQSIQFPNLKAMQVCINNYISMYGYNFGYVVRTKEQLALAV